MCMQNSVKQEAFIGIISILIFIFLIFFQTNHYYQSKNVLINRTATTPLVSPSEILTTNAIAKHASSSDCWIMIDNKVYNVTHYLKLHPGGANRIVPYCGQDATVAFQTQGGQGQHSSRATNDLTLFYIGDLNKNITSWPDAAAIQNLTATQENEDD